MIPVLATTTLHTIEYLNNFIDKIDYPVDRLSILCNSSSLDYFLKITNIKKNSFVNKIYFSFCPYNMGCSMSWNYHIKMNPQSNYWILAGDDISFFPGDLERANNISKNSMISFSKNWKYSFFSISQNCINKVGFFDENYHPVSHEDDDYDFRLNKLNINPSYFDFYGHHSGSGCKKNIDQDKINKFTIAFEKNKNYFNKKIHSNDITSGQFDFNERSLKTIEF
jgi:hypothetical protein